MKRIATRCRGTKERCGTRQVEIRSRIRENRGQSDGKISNIRGLGSINEGKRGSSFARFAA